MPAARTHLSPDDKQGHERLMRETHGNRSEMATRLGLSRQGVAARLDRHGLTAEADRLKLNSNTPGPRPAVSKKAQRAERDRILDALSRHPTYEAALHELGMEIATLYRRIAWLGIDDAAIMRRRARTAKQAAAKPSKKPARSPRRSAAR